VKNVLLIICLLSVSCSATSKNVSITGNPLQEKSDEILESVTENAVSVNDEAAIEFLTEEEYRCATAKLLNRFEAREVDAVFSQEAEPELSDSVIIEWGKAMLSCGDFRTWAASYLTEEIETTLNTQLNSDFFDCLSKELSEESAHTLMEEQVFGEYVNPLYDKTLRWVDLGIHVPLNYCAPEIAPVIGALKNA
tara:strand:+ start:873 stop:1454 length:582 start_codon:yes stop_codon:yes gene_type:complete